MSKIRIKCDSMGEKKGINIQVEEDLDALFKEFNLHCKARNLSEATLEFY